MDNQAFQRSIGLVEADVEANCLKHGVRGILEHNDILKIISEYDDDDKQARIFGKFQHLTGLVFKTFHRNVHIITPFAIDPREFVVIEALDPHPRNPDAVLWTALNRKGQFIVVDEIYQNFASSGHLATAIKNKADNYRISKRLIDPSAEIQDQHTGRSLWSDLYSMGLVYDFGSKQRQLATQRIKDALSYQYQGGVYLKAPELYIFAHCERLIWEIQHWQYQEWSGRSSQYKNPSEKPVDKDDHEIENLGRTLLTDIEFTEMIEERPQPHAELLREDQPVQRNINDPYE